MRFVDRGLFRAEIALPTEAPDRPVYRADIMLFQDGRPVSSKTRTLTVEKVGCRTGPLRVGASEAMVLRLGLHGVRAGGRLGGLGGIPERLNGDEDRRRGGVARRQLWVIAPGRDLAVPGPAPWPMASARRRWPGPR